jgi:hypothetical protein
MQTDPADPRFDDDPFAGDDPLAGERPPRTGSPPRSAGSFDPAALFVLLDGLRRAAPRELEGQLTKLIREFLLTLRSLIDWYLERLDQPRREQRVEDIPID